MERLVPISAIRVGERHRKDMGDIDTFAASIKAVGLLQPIGTTPGFDLVYGERRLEAFKRLGRTEIPVRFIDIEQLVMGEFHENEMRKDFALSERVAIWRTIEQKPHGDQARSQNFATVDQAAKLAGFGNRESARQAEEIVRAAEEEPERFGHLVPDMDKSGKVNGPYRRLKVARQAEDIRREPPPLPNRGPYRVIAADPPWPYEIGNEDPSHRATHPYPQMSIEQICAVPVATIAHDDALLWLWTTNHHMREAFGVLDAWGFQHKTILTWVKNRFGTGAWLRGQTEHVVMAARGKPIVELNDQSTVLHGPLRANSQKPDEFYEFVERLCPAPRYAELFARSCRPNWDGHGDELPADSP